MLKFKTLIEMLSKLNVDNVLLHELLENKTKSVDVNFIKNFKSNDYWNNNNNGYARPPYIPNNNNCSGNNVSSNSKLSIILYSYTN
jgi:hypothetical protein